MTTYRIHRAKRSPQLADAWAAAVWEPAETLKVGEIRPESGGHCPETLCRLLYDEAGIYGRFLVEDRYVVSRRKQFQDPVCEDSCVEFFVQPGGSGPYFNLEINCSGVFLLYKVIDPTREVAGGPLKEIHKLTAAEAVGVQVCGTVSGPREEELPGPLEWEVGFFLPFALFKTLMGVDPPQSGDRWRANFYKCADESSRPHWLSWQPISALNFHLPDCFGPLEFV